MKYRNMGGEERKAKVRASNDRRDNHNKTNSAEDRVAKKHARGKRKETAEKISQMRLVKKKRREAVLTRGD